MIDTLKIRRIARAVREARSRTRPVPQTSVGGFTVADLAWFRRPVRE